MCKKSDQNISLDHWVWQKNGRVEVEFFFLKPTQEEKCWKEQNGLRRDENQDYSINHFKGTAGMWRNSVEIRDTATHTGLLPLAFSWLLGQQSVCLLNNKCCGRHVLLQRHLHRHTENWPTERFPKAKIQAFILKEKWIG